MLLFISKMNEPVNELVAKMCKAVEDAETLQRNVLISKMTGTVAASVGTTLNIIGIILIPFSFGLSVPILCGTGTALAVTGSLTSLGTTIADISIQSQQKMEIVKLIDDCVNAKDTYVQKSKKLEHTLRKCDSSASQYFGEFFRRKLQSDVTMWLKAGHLHRDVSVAPGDLRKRDHIYRIIRSSPCHQHHGIYINEQKVVELCRSLEDFLEGQPIKKREYMGCDLPAEESAKLACDALNQPSSKDCYGLLTNNCEHFATSMKLSIQWSGQVDNSLTITSEVFKNVHRPISVIIESVESGTQVVAALAPKSFFSFFSAFSTPVMSNLAKAALVLGPVSVALDITSLVFEFRKQNVSADVCRDAINQLKKFKSDTQKYEAEVRKYRAQLTERRRQAELFEEEVRRFEAKRMEDERIEKR